MSTNCRISLKVEIVQADTGSAPFTTTSSAGTVILSTHEADVRTQAHE
jgi:hypothetical protein